MFFSSPLFALLPSVAKRASGKAIGYGFLLGCFGVGAIAGALVMQRARGRWSMEAIVSTGVGVLGLVMLAISGSSSFAALAPAMLIGGAAWVVFISLVTSCMQRQAPDWVRARVLAIFTLVYQGSFALGSAVWGAVAQRASVRLALLCSGIGTIGTLAFAFFAKLPDSAADVTPWDHWRMPTIAREVGVTLDRGPVLVTIEYAVVPGRDEEFVDTIHQYSRTRRRDGAYRWGIYRDFETPNRYIETFLVHSWAEHLRQHERQTQADREMEQRLQSYVSADPIIHHLLYAQVTES
jgi:hypothetical protein